MRPHRGVLQFARRHSAFPVIGDATAHKFRHELNRHNACWRILTLIQLEQQVTFLNGNAYFMQRQGNSPGSRGPCSSRLRMVHGWYARSYLSGHNSKTAPSLPRVGMAVRYSMERKNY